MPEPSISNPFGLSPTPVPTDTLVPPIITETPIATGIPTPVTPGTPTSLVQKLGAMARGTFFGGAPSAAIPNETPATIVAAPNTEPTPTLTPVSSVPPSDPQVIVPPGFGEPSLEEYVGTPQPTTPAVPEPVPAAPVAPEPVIPPTPEPPTLAAEPSTPAVPEPVPTPSEITLPGAFVEQPPSIEEKIASLPDTISLEDGSNPFAATLKLVEKEAGRELTREEHQELLSIVYQLCFENQLAVPAWGLQGIPATGSTISYSNSVKEALLNLAAKIKQNPQLISQ